MNFNIFKYLRNLRKYHLDSIFFSTNPNTVQFTQFSTVLLQCDIVTSIAFFEDSSNETIGEISVAIWEIGASNCRSDADVYIAVLRNYGSVSHSWRQFRSVSLCRIPSLSIAVYCCAYIYTSHTRMAV